MSEIVVYTTEPCAYCARVKGLLRSRNLEFAEINLSGDHAARVELAQRTGMMTFPQVLIDGVLLGGFDELESAARSGRLEEFAA